MPPGDAERKSAASAIAAAALSGLRVYPLVDGRYLAVWGVARELPDAEAVLELARRMGGAT